MSAGKGKGPIKGYNYKNFYANYDGINWHKKWCSVCGKWSNHTISSCPEIKKINEITFKVFKKTKEINYGKSTKNTK
jgi:hypothetical protein